MCKKITCSTCQKTTWMVSTQPSDIPSIPVIIRQSSSIIRYITHHSINYYC